MRPLRRALESYLGQHSKAGLKLLVGGDVVGHLAVVLCTVCAKGRRQLREGGGKAKGRGSPAHTKPGKLAGFQYIATRNLSKRERKWKKMWKNDRIFGEKREKYPRERQARWDLEHLRTVSTKLIPGQ